MQKNGFTLIEILVVIAVMAILAATVFAALNPTARFQSARNSRRYSDVNAILSAIKLDQVDHGGVLYEALDLAEVGQAYMIGTGYGAGDFICKYPDVDIAEDSVDFSYYVDNGAYLSQVPIDPLEAEYGATPEFTGYYFIKEANGTIQIGTCFEELGGNDEVVEISVRR